MCAAQLAVPALLSDMGVVVDVQPGSERVRLCRGRSVADYDLRCGSSLRIADLAAGPSSSSLLVFTDYVSPRTADAFRRAGVQYVDMAGNAWLHFGDVLVDVSGKRRTVSTPVSGTAGNLFSTRRAQVVFALLTWPWLWRATRRQLAHAAGVSVGQAQSTWLLLDRAGYGGQDLSAAKPGLLELWAAAFPTGLGSAATLGRFYGSADQVKVASPLETLYLSGEAASPDLRPASVVVYAAALGAELPTVNRWRTDVPPNITVRKAFWNDPNNTLSGVLPAPWPLVYADLLASDDPRVRAVAQKWKDDHGA
jgi:hypothetical protein